MSYRRLKRTGTSTLQIPSLKHVSFIARLCSLQNVYFLHPRWRHDKAVWVCIFLTNRVADPAFKEE